MVTEAMVTEVPPNGSSGSSMTTNDENDVSTSIASSSSSTTTPAQDPATSTPATGQASGTFVESSESTSATPDPSPVSTTQSVSDPSLVSTTQSVPDPSPVSTTQSLPTTVNLSSKDQACNPNQSEHGGSCYHFSLDASDFETSIASCTSLGMHLVFIGSQDEQDFLIDNAFGDKYWIGLSTVTSLDNAATSTWLDGSSLTYINFANSSLAFNAGGECFRIAGPDLQYKWADKGCSVKVHYICETENGISSEATEEVMVTEAMVTEVLPNGSSGPSMTTNDEHDVSTSIVSSSSTTTTPAQDPATSTSATGQASGTFVDSTESTSATPDPSPVPTTQSVPTTATLSPRDKACSPNQIEYGGSCYYFSLDYSDFDTSRASCASHGMHLVFIGSEDEQDFLVVTGPENEYWIGLSEVTSRDNIPTATWLDGSRIYSDATEEVMVTEAMVTEVPPSGSSGPSMTTNDENDVSTSIASSSSTTPAQDPATSTTATGQASRTCEESTECTSATPDPSPVPTTQSVPTTATLSPRDQVLKRTSTILKLSADNARLLDAYVHASFRVSSLIGCAQHCFADVTCSCVTYIAHERACLLGEECQTASGVRYDKHPGAKTYSRA
eukprot:XP_011674600.1 PREDICTED: mucin-5AC-like [Strongylocentrotus purpuratus]